jgi:hypothetical protein
MSPWNWREPCKNPDPGFTDRVELERLVALGATVIDPVADVGEGIKVAAVQYPFGNRFGIIENPNFRPSDVR